ncbi:MAG: ABC transporter ATP-binding protein [bacterium]
MIKVEHISKVFRIPHQMRNTLYFQLTSLLHTSFEYEIFHALRDVSFDVRQGEFLGIMGRNGSGKTTLLRILSGVYRPNSGSYSLGGTISPLLELGLGFQPRLTCRDNVFIYGSLLGFPRKEMSFRYDEVMRFAELERFADMPLEHLSSGMKVRLAFAIAIQSAAPIILVDEVLAVGDVFFQKKCRKVFQKFKEEGKTVLFVSHDLGTVKEFCDRVLILHDGIIASEFPRSRFEELQLERIV